jgi:hypothetical protein
MSLPRRDATEAVSLLVLVQAASARINEVTAPRRTTVREAGFMCFPSSVAVVKAFAFGRDVDVLVAERTHGEISGRRRNDYLINDVPSIAEEDRDQIVRIHAHTGLGDVTVRIGNRPRTTGATYRSE